MSRRFTTLAATGIAALLTLVAAPTPAGIATTVHNLSVSGPGTRKATSESEICLFCHVPHNAAPAGQLWSRRTGTGYTPYSSSTLKSAPGQPNGASLLCLSCHDGTIALGEVVTRASAIAMAGGALAGNPLLGTNLADDHPVSFVYDAALRAARGELADPATLVKPGKVRLDGGSRLQCTSCHDPHDNTVGKFLTTSNVSSALCQTCHQKNYWAGSDHRNSTKTWNGVAPNPWPHTTQTTVATNACENCHQPHTAGGSKRLLNYASEESNCFSCHNGNVAAKNIQAEFSKTSRHNVAGYTGIHDPAEPASTATAHVECVDCHNPHAAYASTPPAGSIPGGSATPALAGSQIGVRGIDINGAAVNPANAEYEICFRCHADGAANIPAPSIGRVIAQNNKRLEFQPTNPSYHPIAAAGRSTTNVPSLIAPWTTSSRVRCTDCHNNNAGPYSSGTPAVPTGTGPNGPHGSTIAPLLERANPTALTTSSSTAYPLCYKCHSSTSILGNAAGSFPLHNYHIVGFRIPCSACHDPHGVSSTQGTVLNNSRLMNFATALTGISPLVTPTAKTGGGTEPIRWERTTPGHGRCFLDCHVNGSITHNATTKTY